MFQVRRLTYQRLDSISRSCKHQLEDIERWLLQVNARLEAANNDLAQQKVPRHTPYLSHGTDCPPLSHQRVQRLALSAPSRRLHTRRATSPVCTRHSPGYIRERLRTLVSGIAAAQMAGLPQIRACHFTTA